MHLQQMWHQFFAEQGNEPGLHQGKITITLLNPVSGIGELTVPSGAVSVAAEAGSFIGLLVAIPVEGGPRRLFINDGNIAGIIDAETKGDKPKDAEDDSSGTADSGDDGKPGPKRAASRAKASE